MTHLEKIEKLRQEFVATKNPDPEYFKKKMAEDFLSLNEEEKKEFVASFVESADKACSHAEKVYNFANIKMKLAGILEMVSMSYIADKYFNKSRSWFSHRLNNHNVNGSPAAFTNEELKILSKALDEIGQSLKDTARSIA
jgi:hypothetical protein